VERSATGQQVTYRVGVRISGRLGRGAFAVCLRSSVTVQTTRAMKARGGHRLHRRGAADRHHGTGCGEHPTTTATSRSHRAVAHMAIAKARTEMVAKRTASVQSLAGARSCSVRPEAPAAARHSQVAGIAVPRGGAAHRASRRTHQRTLPRSRRTRTNTSADCQIRPPVMHTSNADTPGASPPGMEASAGATSQMSVAIGSAAAAQTPRIEEIRNWGMPEIMVGVAPSRPVAIRPRSGATALRLATVRTCFERDGPDDSAGPERWHMLRSFHSARITKLDSAVNLDRFDSTVKVIVGFTSFSSMLGATPNTWRKGDMRPVKAKPSAEAHASRRQSKGMNSPGADAQQPLANGHRRADAVRNREAIVSAAVQVLTHKPDAGLAEVARASGLTRTTVYAHFATREELLEELAGRALAETVHTLDVAEPDDGPADEALLRVVRASWRQVGSQARLLDMIGSALGPRAAEMHAPVRERLLKLIKRGRRDGTFRRDVPERWLMTTYFTLVHAAGHEVAVGNATYGEAENALSKLLLGAFSVTER